jgi:hypothetical protein
MSSEHAAKPGRAGTFDMKLEIVVIVDSGLNPQRQSYASYASFSDPDGNGWLLQEITVRLSADIEVGDPRFTSEILKAIHAPTPAG